MNYSRTPLTTNQHILHLLISVFTAGLWLPVWLFLAVRGNRVYGTASGPIPGSWAAAAEERRQTDLRGGQL